MGKEETKKTAAGQAVEVQEPGKQAEVFLMKPKVDFAFKEIMENKKALIGFLSAVLGIRPEDIRKTQILNANLRREHGDDKLGILDVRVLMNDDTELNTEIHLKHLKVWPERTLFYLAKMYTAQIAPKQDYSVFKKCVSISVLDFKLFRDESEFYSCFHIREDTRNFLYTDRMEFHVIELPKLPEELKEDCSSLELWARFIRAEKKEEFEMLAQRDEYIAIAYEQLQVISQDPEKRLEYEARQKAIRDHNQMMREAREDGWEQGEKHGWEQGEKHGWEQGEKHGWEQGEKHGREQGEKHGWEQGEKHGREQGEERINKLHAFLLEESRFEDLKRSVSDKAFRQQLLEQYGI